MWSLHGMGEWKFVQMVQVTWPIWPPCPYMVKTFQKSSSLELNSRCLESWYAALGTGVLPSLFKWWPWVDLDLFYSKVAFIWEKGNIMDFFSETIVVYDIKVGRFIQLNEYMNLYEYQMSRSFNDLHPRSLRFNIFKILCSETARPIEVKFHMEPPWDVRNENLFTIPIYGENLQKSSSEPRGWWPWNLVYSIGLYSSTSMFSYDDSGLTLTFLWQGQICFWMLLHGWKLIQHWVLMYFQVCSNSAYPQQSALRWVIQDQWSSGFILKIYFVNIYRKFPKYSDTQKICCNH